MRKLLVSAVAAALIVGACSSGLDDATKAYCENLSILQTSVEKMQDLSADTTVAEVQEIRDEVTNAYIVVAESGVEVNERITEEVLAAQQQFDAAVEAIPGDASLGDALQDLVAAKDAYVASLKDTMSKLSCSP